MTSTPPHVNPTGRTAVERLSNSVLTDQREGLGDVDLSQLNLSVEGKTAVHIRALLIDAQLTRTTQGASTLALKLNDSERTLMRSGLFGQSLTIADDFNKTALGQQLTFFRPIDTEIDGLFFRLVQAVATGDTVQLTFEDREVSLLRSYPKDGDPNTAFAFSPGMTRIQVMRFLIDEVKETVEPIRIVSPMLDVPDPILKATNRPSAVVKGLNHAPGFSASSSGVTVKHVAATAQQLATLEQILDVGYSMFKGVYSLAVIHKLLVCEVMAATQESDVHSGSRNGSHVGTFQQDESPHSIWVQLGGATGSDPSADAHAFCVQLQKAYEANPGSDDASLVEAVQVSGQGHLYAQWNNEAIDTVSIYLGSPGSRGSAATSVVTPGRFERGAIKVVAGTPIPLRESNWAMLQRLAQEVGWSCYVVSGTVYIEPNRLMNTGAVRFVFDEDHDGVDTIDFNINTSRSTATATVTCRAKTWQAPPGTVCQIRNRGPADGRWFVTTIQRSLFSPTATITLGKPQATLLDAESASPIQAGQIPVSGSGSKGVAVASSPIRAAIVAAAKKAAVNEKLQGDYIYLQARPYPFGLFGGVKPITLDCSSFSTLVYRAAGAEDPNGRGYDGEGNTATLWANGTITLQPQPGDLAFWGREPTLGPGAPAHVAVLIEDGNIVNMGSPNSGEPKVMPFTAIGLEFRGYRTYQLTKAKS